MPAWPRRSSGEPLPAETGSRRSFSPAVPCSRPSPRPSPGEKVRAQPRSASPPRRSRRWRWPALQTSGAFPALVAWQSPPPPWAGSWSCAVSAGIGRAPDRDVRLGHPSRGASPAPAASPSRSPSPSTTRAARLTRELRATLDDLVAARRTIGLQRAEIERASTVDPLTGLPSRGPTLDRLRTEAAEARRYAHPVTVVLLDIDGFAAHEPRLRPGGRRRDPARGGAPPAPAHPRGRCPGSRRRRRVPRDPAPHRRGRRRDLCPGAPRSARSSARSPPTAAR